MILRVALLSLFILTNQAWAQSSQTPLTPAQTHSCEIQAYLIRVVLGLDGDPAVRGEWKSRGINEPLDLEAISDAMKGGERNELAYMILDYNIFELLKVLYHYDPEMNLYKGAFSSLSPYPAPEFIALRLFLLKRLYRSDPIAISILFENPRVIIDSGYSPTPEEIISTGQSMEELTFLRAVIASQPRIYDYIRCPFMVRSLLEAGVLKKDAFTSKKAGEAFYRPLNLSLISGASSAPVKVVFLPSFTRHFRFDQGSMLSPSGFKATEELYEISHKLASSINRSISSDISGKAQKAAGKWADTQSTEISFYLEDERPLAIHPGNAGEVVKEICPDADLAIVILGKNVRLSMHWEYESLANWIFLDEMDIRYDQISQELDTIRATLAEKINR